MRIDWWTLALQAVNVLILVWLLGRFLFRPVMDAIAARQASAQALLDEAREAKDRAQAEAQALKTQNDGFVADAAARRAEIRTEAEAERQRLLAQARLEADAVVEQGHAAIDAERGRVAAQWREKAASLDDHVPDLCAQIERTGQIDTAQRSALMMTVKALIESRPAGSAS